MKPILSTIFFVFLFIAQSSAQTMTSTSPTYFNKGSWQVGLRDGYQGGILIGNRNTLQLQAGYYLVKQLAVGISGTWAREGFNSSFFHDLTVGPYARYQFMNSRFSPFLDLSYQLGSRISDRDAFSFSSLNMQSAQVSPGISVGVTRSFRAELSYHFQWLSVPNWTTYIGQPQLGLTYLLSKH